MRKFFAYARVSSQEQADRDLSIPAQQRAIRKYAYEQRLQIAQEFVDVESAKEPGRRNFTAMLAQLRRRPDVSGVLSHKLDRLLRNLKDYADVDDLMRQGKQFLFTTESYDDSASGKLALGVRVLFAKHYLDNLSEETKKGLHERMLERGKWSFVAPLGYLNQNGDVVPDPVRAPLIKKAFELYATADWSVFEITDYLYTQGLRTRPVRRSESGRFIESRVHAMLRNPFYCGLMRFRGQVIRGVHEPLIDKTLYDQVQAAMDRYKKKWKKKRPWFTYRGLVVCGECGRAVTAEQRVKYYRGTDRRAVYIYYHCTKSGGPQSCSQQPIKEEDLFEQLAEQIRPIELTGNEYDLLKEVLKDSHGDEQRFRDEQLAKLHQLKADIQRKLDALLDRLVDGTITKEIYNAKSEALEGERQAAEVAIYGHEQANRSYFEQMENFLDAAKSIYRVFLAGSSKERREVVQLVASDVTLAGGKARLNLKRPCAILAARPAIPCGVTDGN